MSDTSISSMRKGGDVESFTRANLTAVALLAIPVGDAIWDCRCSFFFFFLFFPPLLSGPYIWNRYSQRLQIE